MAAGGAQRLSTRGARRWPPRFEPARPAAAPASEPRPQDPALRSLSSASAERSSAAAEKKVSHERALESAWAGGSFKRGARTRGTARRGGGRGEGLHCWAARVGGRLSRARAGAEGRLYAEGRSGGCGAFVPGPGGPSPGGLSSQPRRGKAGGPHSGPGASLRRVTPRDL